MDVEEQRRNAEHGKILMTRFHPPVVKKTKDSAPIGFGVSVTKKKSRVDPSDAVNIGKINEGSERNSEM